MKDVVTARFINRVYLIRERYEHFASGDADAAATWGDADDPFWDPNEPVPASSAHHRESI